MPDQIAGGKLPKRFDYRTIAMPSLMRTNRPVPPEYVDNQDKVKKPWNVLGNDTQKDCTCAAAGHAEMLWTAERAVQVNPTQDDILKAYSAITGYKAGDPATDNGADLLSVLKYWQSTGIAGQQIHAFAEISPRDIDMLKWTISSLGFAYVGILLPSAWVVKFKGGTGPPFDTDRRFLDPATWQNPINGHCVIYTGYCPDGLTCVTWGDEKKVSWAFHKANCDEAYAIIPPEPADSAEASLNLEKLQKSLDAVKAMRPVGTPPKASPRTSNSPAESAG